MSEKNVSIEIDEVSRKNLEKQFAALGTTINKASPKAIFRVLMKIKQEAQLRLTGRGHVITSRLRNSIYVKMPGKQDNRLNPATYKDTEGKTYSSDLTTVSLEENEGAVGTNVEYAAAIELGYEPFVIKAKEAKSLGTADAGFFGKEVNHPGYAGDSYLYWAMKNVDITKTVKEDMLNDLKFGLKLKQ